jgi:hypothetical protein
LVVVVLLVLLMPVMGMGNEAVGHHLVDIYPPLAVVVVVPLVLVVGLLKVMVVQEVVYQNMVIMGDPVTEHQGKVITEALGEGQVRVVPVVVVLMEQEHPPLLVMEAQLVLTVYAQDRTYIMLVVVLVVVLVLLVDKAGILPL